MSTTLKVSTWNVNSVRKRLDQIARFVATANPDIIALQETKCQDKEFPLEEFSRLGYPHLLLNGQKGYHGVAIASKVNLSQSCAFDFNGSGDARHVAATIVEGPFEGLGLHNFYVPAGGDKPDPDINLKFAQKLKYMEGLITWSQKLARVSERRILVVGDINIAPLVHDVWDHKKMLKVVSHTPIECEMALNFFEAGQWVDVLRQFTPEPQKLYTWWSYRSPDWKGLDKGRRLDHVLCSPLVQQHVKSVDLMKETREWQSPSDHIPITVHLKSGVTT